MARKLIVIVLVVGIYCIGIFSGIALLIYPAFNVKRAVQVRDDVNTLNFRFSSGNLLLFKDVILGTPAGAIEVELKKDGKVVKKGTEEVVAILDLR